MWNKLTREDFLSMYAQGAPWEIGEPQEMFIQIADQVEGSILDIGCGSGDLALYYAARGHQVTGIDFLDEPIAKAREKATERDLNISFFSENVLNIHNWNQQFDNVMDCGLLHCLADEERPIYLAGLRNVLRPGGTLFLACWSDAEADSRGPQRLSNQDLLNLFHGTFKLQSLQPCRLALWSTRPERKHLSKPVQETQAWFAIFRRVP